MCLGTNGEIVAPGERCASTSNRNFVGRQGPGARTHLMSPAMAAAAAVAGRAHRRAPSDGRRLIDGPIPPPRSRGATDAAAEHRHRPDHPRAFPAAKPRRRNGAGYLFHDLRFHTDGAEQSGLRAEPRFPIVDARIIVADRNFGCGSSRENAVWALYDYGFRVAIAPSFGDIFATNCQKNGFLTIAVTPELIARTLKTLLESPGARIAVDLPAQTLTLAEDVVAEFELDPFAKRCLIEGVDELGFTLTQLDRIIAFENNRPLRPPRTIRPAT